VKKVCPPTSSQEPLLLSINEGYYLLFSRWTNSTYDCEDELILGKESDQVLDQVQS
jgi:hypothetical protein